MGLMSKVGLVVVTGLLALQAQATQISYQFSVRVDSINEFTGYELTGNLASVAYPLGGAVSVGDTFTGKFSIDDNKLEIPSGMQTDTSRYFVDVSGTGHGLSFTMPGMGAYTSSGTPNSGIVQLMNESYDYFSMSDTGSAVSAGFVLANWEGTAFNSLALPSNVALTDFEYAWFRTSWFTDVGSIAIDGHFTALSPVAGVGVPEPATWTILLAGLACLAGLRLRYKA